MNQRQLQMIEYLREENRVLREQLGERRWRLTDDQRRRLAAKAKGLGRKLLAEVATIVTPETLCFVCGPPALVDDVPALLVEIGIARERIRIEEW